MLLAVGALLMQADAVFGSLLSGAAGALGSLDGAALRKLALTLAGGLVLFSLLYSTLTPPQAYAAPAGRRGSPALWATPLTLLGALYALFVYVQVRYLFAGAESVAMTNGYAQYARSGFFQMTAAALITLGMLLPALTLCRESRLVRGLCAAVSLLTLVVVFSAFWRMRLYILTYGMSLLRALTLWAMAMFAAAFALALVKCARTSFRLCPALAAIVLGAWVALNLCLKANAIVRTGDMAAQNSDIAAMVGVYSVGVGNIQIIENTNSVNKHIITACRVKSPKRSVNNGKFLECDVIAFFNIFGPTKDWECLCGKYKRVHYANKKCEKCGVDVTTKKVRRERMGHIELATPVSHIWYFRAIPSKMGTLLDMSPRQLEKVLYYAQYIVIDPGDTSLAKYQLLTEREYKDSLDRYGDEFKVGMGGAAIKELLHELDIEALSAQLKDELKNASGQKKAKIIKRLEVVESFRKSGNKPEWMILDVLPVLPPDIRPMVQLDGGRFASSDLNDLYRRVINRNNRLTNLVSLGIRIVGIFTFFVSAAAE